METKVCMFFNDLALYRKAIYKMLDNEYECKWYIEDKDTHVKCFEESELKNVCRLPVKRIGRFYWTKGLISLLKGDFEVYFMLGATANLSLFIFLLLKNIFYPQKRAYLWAHGYYGKESKIELAIWKRPLLKMATGVFTYGEYARDLMVKDGFDKNRLYPIHNSLDYDSQIQLRKQISGSDIYLSHFRNNNPVVIFIGRLTPVKRLDMLIRSIAILKAMGICYNLVFIGEGSETEKLKEMVQKEKIAEQVWFYGECYSEQKNAELIYNADLCVAPGNIGLTAIHVLMFGCPAISHDNFPLQMPEFESIKSGKTGDFYEYGSVTSLANKISEWFSNNNLNREEIRKYCYKEIDENWNPYFQMKVVKENLL